MVIRFYCIIYSTCAQPPAWQLWQVQNVHNSSSKLDSLFLDEKCSFPVLSELIQTPQNGGLGV
jgi:hypothetical protein